MDGKRLLHITNGDGLTEKLQQLELPGEVVVWREMLCEGPCVSDVSSVEFIRLRKKFLKEAYGISEKEYQAEFLEELEKLSALQQYDEIVLWFEFDLFSHMNMLALISNLLQKVQQQPFYLVCSGRLKGEEELVPLSELSVKQLLEHYRCRIELVQDDLEMANLIWELYCGNKPARLISEIKKTSNFEYLSSCIRAHIERFPSTKSGLNTLEENILKLINRHNITSLHQLLGYALQYQGYYGYVDVQMQRVIDKLSAFYTLEDVISLNETGRKALDASQNFYQELKDSESYGGVRKYDFLYNPDTHNLHKL